MDCDIAKSIWKYDPNTGYFFWLIKASAGTKVGERAGYFDGKYWRLSFKKKNFKASRVAWLMMTGEWPSNQVDHKNRDKTDDSWDNLRLATNAENCRNRSVRVDNKLNIKGVCPVKYGYRTQLSLNGKIVFSKFFKDLEMAKTAYEMNAVKFHGQYAVQEV